MKESKDRTEQFMYSAAAATSQSSNHLSPPNSNDTLRRRSPSPRSDLLNPSRPESRNSKGKGRFVPGVDDGDQFLAVDLSGDTGARDASNPFQQMQLVEQQVCFFFPSHPL